MAHAANAHDKDTDNFKIQTNALMYNHADNQNNIKISKYHALESRKRSNHGETTYEPLTISTYVNKKLERDK